MLGIYQASPRRNGGSWKREEGSKAGLQAKREHHKAAASTKEELLGSKAVFAGSNKSSAGEALAFSPQLSVTEAAKQVDSSYKHQTPYLVWGCVGPLTAPVMYHCSTDSSIGGAEVPAEWCSSWLCFFSAGLDPETPSVTTQPQTWIPLLGCSKGTEAASGTQMRLSGVDWTCT